MAIALRAPTNPTLVIETTNVFVRSDKTEIPTKNAHPAAIKLTMSPTTSRMRKSLNTGIGIVINCRHRNCASERQPARPKTVLFIMRSNYWLGDGTAIIEVRRIGVELQRAATPTIEVAETLTTYPFIARTLGIVRAGCMAFPLAIQSPDPFGIPHPSVKPTPMPGMEKEVRRSYGRLLGRTRTVGQCSPEGRSAPKGDELATGMRHHCRSIES